MKIVDDVLSGRIKDAVHAATGSEEFVLVYRSGDDMHVAYQCDPKLVPQVLIRAWMLTKLDEMKDAAKANDDSGSHPALN